MLWLLKLSAIQTLTMSLSLKGIVHLDIVFLWKVGTTKTDEPYIESNISFSAWEVDFFSIFHADGFRKPIRAPSIFRWALKKEPALLLEKQAFSMLFPIHL
jgi:hypothetical protein